METPIPHMAPRGHVLVHPPRPRMPFTGTFQLTLSSLRVVLVVLSAINGDARAVDGLGDHLTLRQHLDEVAVGVLRRSHSETGQAGTRRAHGDETEGQRERT